MKYYKITWVEEHSCTITAKDKTEAEYLFHNASVFKPKEDTFDDLLSVGIELKEGEAVNETV